MQDRTGWSLTQSFLSFSLLSQSFSRAQLPANSRFMESRSPVLAVSKKSAPMLSIFQNRVDYSNFAADTEFGKN